MPFFTKDSLETLRQKIDLVELLSSRIDLKRMGSSYKALCPFHDEKSPSFVVQKGDTHYHCYGCGAHGDAIAFLMEYQKITFVDAVEMLAQIFHVHLEQEEGGMKNQGSSKALLKKLMLQACEYYQFLLFHTLDGHEALQYLYGRGLDLNFIRHFQIGLSPRRGNEFRKFMHSKKNSDALLEEAGLITPSNKGGWRDFFCDRITFPIHSATGEIIAFSARKYRKETFGGKYVNSPETFLFKKNRTLFSLHLCRRRIAKERKAIIVEGQIDALRLIYHGFDIAVAGQGTAFGEGHVKELVNLGVNIVYLALDADEAGKEAARKIGHLFQKIGIEVYVLELPFGSDPDSILNERGPKEFMRLLENSCDYLTFLVDNLGRQIDIDSPAGKSELVEFIAKKIREWDSPLMVHESLRKLARLVNVPEDTVGIGVQNISHFYVKKFGNISQADVDPNRVLEADFLRWLILLGETHPHFVETAKLNLSIEDLQVLVCQRVYQAYLKSFENEQTLDLLSLMIDIDNKEGQEFISEIFEKKVNKEKAEENFYESIQKILDRNVMCKREEIKAKIQGGRFNDEETLKLAKDFAELKRQTLEIPQKV